MQKLWSAGETVAIVEHDIVPWPGAINRLFECDQELCLYLAPLFLYDGGYMFCRGPVVKYSASLMARFPAMVEQLKDRHWRNVVEGLLVPLSGLVPVHEHSPAVAHIKPLEEWGAYCERLRAGQD